MQSFHRFLTVVSLIVAAFASQSRADGTVSKDQAEFNRLEKKQVVEAFRTKDGVQFYDCAPQTQVPDADHPGQSKWVVVPAPQLATTGVGKISYRWNLREAKAELIDDNGKRVGEHIFLPNENDPSKLDPAWRIDGHGVLRGKKLGALPAKKKEGSAAEEPFPRSKEIPAISGGPVADLVIKHAGGNIDGALAKATDLERVDTIGGNPGDPGCKQGDPELKLGYFARYVFYNANAPAAAQPGFGGGENDTATGGKKPGSAH